MRGAVRAAEIVKHATPHTLRHFATHLLLKNVNIRQVQQCLGQKRLETTMIYTHVVPELLGDAFGSTSMSSVSRSSCSFWRSFVSSTTIVR